MEQALIRGEGPEPAGEAKPDVCVLSDSKAAAYCTVGLVFEMTTVDYIFMNLQKNRD